MFALHEVVVHFGAHRTWTVQGVDGNDFFYRFGMQLFEQAPHAVGFKLEHAGRFAFLQQLERQLVFFGNAFKVDVDPFVFLNQLYGDLQYR